MSAAPRSAEGTQVPLAIVGIGALFPKAEDLGAYWQNVQKGRDAIGDVPPTRWRTQDYLDPDPKAQDRLYAARGGFLSAVDFDPLEFGIAPNDLEATDTSQILGLIAAKRALADAGYGFGERARPFDRARTSVIIGVTGTLELVIPLGARLGHPLWRRALAEAGVPDEVADDVVARIGDGYAEWQEGSFPGLLGNVVAGRIASRLDLHGTNCVVDAACGSSLAALHLAALELETGRSDMVVTGGVDTFNDVFMFMCFSKTTALSPTGAAKPFDSTGDGTVLGEGVGVVVLKRLADAERDGDRVYAVLRGLGTSSDGKGQAIYAPSAVGQARALRRAYESAGVSPATVELVEAHGTGTKVGDTVEATALGEVFRESGRTGRWAALGSVKSQIGHAKAAAGVAGLVKSALALYHKVLPPTIKVTDPIAPLADESSPLYLNTEARPWLRPLRHPRRAALSAFGFGGSNYHAVLEEHASTKPGIDWDPDVELLPFRAETVRELLRDLEAWPADLAWDELARRAATARERFDVLSPCRLVLVVERGRTDLAKLVANAAAMLRRDPHARSWSTPDGAHFGQGQLLGKLAMLFPGQGSQYVGMLRDLACRFPVVQHVLEKADIAYELAAGGVVGGVTVGLHLSDRIFPHAPFNDVMREKAEWLLRDTRVAQPAIGAVSLGALAVLASVFGVGGTAFAGHSYGELAALHAGGAFDADTLAQLSALRGRLMAEGEGDRGAMLAVRTDRAGAVQIVEENGLKLAVANHNAPQQVVLSGASDEIERAALRCAALGLAATKLAVAAAFHSPLVADAATPLREALDAVAVAAPHTPVYANATAEPYPPDPDALRATLAAQLASSVEFVALIERMYADGARTFVEVGPGTTLTRLVGAILAEREHAACAVDASGGRRSGMADLAACLAQIAVQGHSVDLARWNEGVAKPAAPPGRRMTVAVSGANIVRAKAPRPPRAPLPLAAETPRTVAASAPPPTPVPPMPHTHEQPVPPAATPGGVPVPPPRGVAAGASVAAALDAVRAQTEALLRLSAQTADLHRRFLESQDAAQRSLEVLLDQQRALLGLPPLALPAPAPLAAQPYVAPPAAAPLAATPQAVAAPAPVAPAPAPSAAPAAARPAPAPVRLAPVLLAVVSEKTGYPAEMLELPMELDADLGIDSIKRVEILAAMQERVPGLAAVASDELGRLRTLADVLAALDRSAPPTATPAAASPATASAPRAQIAPVQIAPVQLAPVQLAPVLLAVVSEKTGYPAEMLELPMELDADLGIDSIKRVEILAAMQERVPGLAAVASDELGRLRTLADVLAALDRSAPPTATPAAASPATASAPRAQIAPVQITPVQLAPVLLAVVSEKTGYPAEMLELPMELDADLGIDSIKRVEILAAMQERVPGLAAVASDELGRLRTLADVLAALDRTAAPSAAAPAASPVAATQAPAAAAAEQLDVQRHVLGSVALEGRARAAVAPAAAPVLVAGDVSGELTQAVAAAFAAVGAHAQVAELDTGDVPSALAGLVLVAPARGTDAAFLRGALALLGRAGAALREGARQGGAFLVGVSRLDGAFGLVELNGAAPECAGLAGFVKTAAHEWPEVACKALDVPVHVDDVAAAARAVVEEALLRGPLEVGLAGASRVALRLAEEPVAGASAAPLAPGDLVVVTGGARGVTAEAAIALAEAFRPALLLLGRSPEPADEPACVAGIDDAAAAKRALAAEMGGRPAPRELQAAWERIASARAVRATLARCAAHGATAAYRSVDVRDAAAVAAIVAEARASHGPVRALVHGAGVLRDARIEEKTPAQFDDVFGTKVDGLRALLAAAGDDDLRALVLFSSSTGRFGRAGQVDYAAANEVLNKIAQREARRRPACRVVSVNWGPWEGGMVTPAHRRLFADEGIGLIGLRAGARHLVRELHAGAGAAVEVVVLGPGSRAPEQFAADAAPSAEHDTSALPLAFERSVDVTSHPVLASHVLDGRPVVPVVLMLQWLAHGALHVHPGLRFHGFDAFRMLRGVPLDDGAAARLRVHVGRLEPQADGTFAAAAELRSTDAHGRERVTARAQVVLGDRGAHANGTVARPLAPEPGAPSRATVYDDLLFHGPAMQGIRAVEHLSRAGVAVVSDAAPAPSAWVRAPLRSAWPADPLALDCAFQALVVWTRAHRGAPSLPTGFARYRQFAPAFPDSGVRITAHVTSDAEHATRADVLFTADDGRVLAEMRGYECVVDPSLDAAYRRRSLADATRS